MSLLLPHGTLTLTDALPWRTFAACDPQDTEVFFPEKWGQTAAAKAICHTCPVQAECLDAADDDFGIWGGLTPGERRSR
jgi:WhiB family transcriptional regulator, redox-sensing transcriptional regulator